MRSRDFCFWLQGYFELSDSPGRITAEQAALVRRHLDLVFAHELAPTSFEAPVKQPEPALPPVPVTHPCEPAHETPAPTRPVEPQTEPPRC